MDHRTRNLLALIAIALLSALLIVTRVREGRRSPSVTAAPRVLLDEPHASPSDHAPPAQPSYSRSVSTHESEGRDQLPVARPERPRCFKLTNEILAHFQQYMRELRLYCADSESREINQILASQGAGAALAYIRRSASDETCSPPPFIVANAPFHDVDGATLSTFDFERWFRSLVAVRLISSIATREGSPEVLRSATDVVFEILRNTKDPFVARFTAANFSTERSYAAPMFGQVHAVATHGPTGLSFDFVGVDPRYCETTGYRESGGVLEAMCTSLVPLLHDSPWATAELARALPQLTETGAQCLLLESVTSLPHWEEYRTTYLKLVGDPDMSPWVRDDALALLKGYGESQELRNAVDCAISSAADNQVRVIFIEHLRDLYPVDHSYSNTLAVFVRDAAEDRQVRTTAAKALMSYYMGERPDPSYRPTLDAYFAELIHEGMWEDSEDLFEETMALHAKQFTDTYRSILSSIEASPQGVPDLELTRKKLRSYLQGLDHGDDPDPRLRDELEKERRRRSSSEPK